MANIKLRRGSGVPSGLTFGEPAFDITNSRLYVGITGGSALVGVAGGGVHSFNGLTGAVTGVTTGTANTFGPLQSFTNGICSSDNINVYKTNNSQSLIQTVQNGTGGVASAVISTAAYPGYRTLIKTTSENYTTNPSYPSETSNSGILYCDAPAALRIHSYNAPLEFWTGNPGSRKASLNSAGLFDLGTGGINAGGGTFGNSVRITGTSTASSSSTQGILNVYGSATNALIFGTLTISPFAGYIQSGGSSTYPLALNPVAGNVGIGLVAPAARLHVAGDIYANSGICAAGGTFSALTRFTSGICASGGITLSGNLSATTASFSGLMISTAGFSGTGITLSGNLSAATKSFLIPHPIQPNKKLQYACLEGPENGVYVRGRLTGSNVIDLPDYWTALVHSDSITVQLTANSSQKNYFVKSIEENRIIVGSKSKEIDCFYLVQGERKDVPKLVVEA